MDGAGLTSVLVDSDLIDTLQTELNKYKVVIEKEPEKVIQWFESVQFKNMVVKRFEDIEDEVGGFAGEDGEEAGGNSRVDKIEKALKELGIKLEDCTVREDLEGMQNEINEERDEDLDKMKEKFKEKLEG